MYPTITNCGYHEDEIQNIFIFDPTRIVLYQKRLNQLLNDSISLAKCVVINKIDQVNEEEIGAVVEMIMAIKPGIRTFKMNINNELSREFKQFF
jgi:Putative GTPases (G3E family)